MTPDMVRQAAAGVMTPDMIRQAADMLRHNPDMIKQVGHGRWDLAGR